MDRYIRVSGFGVQAKITEHGMENGVVALLTEGKQEKHGTLSSQCSNNCLESSYNNASYSVVRTCIYLGFRFSSRRLW